MEEEVLLILMMGVKGKTSKGEGVLFLTKGGSLLESLLLKGKDLRSLQSLSLIELISI